MKWAVVTIKEVIICSLMASVLVLLSFVVFGKPSQSDNIQEYNKLQYELSYTNDNIRLTNERIATCEAIYAILVESGNDKERILEYRSIIDTQKQLLDYEIDKYRRLIKQQSELYKKTNTISNK